MKSIKYTIAIPTFRRPEYLADLLQDLSHQEGNIDFSKWEALVCDNDANESGRIVFDKANLGKFGSSEYLVVREQNISLARNMLCQKAQGEALIYLDDDQRIKLNFCAEIEKFWSDWKEKITGAKLKAIPVFDSHQKTWLRHKRFYFKSLPTQGEPLTFFATNGCVFKTGDLKTLPVVFDPKSGRTGGEDVELFLRLRSQRYRFISAASIEVSERIPANREKVRYLIQRDFFQATNYGYLLRNNCFRYTCFLQFSWALSKVVVCFFFLLVSLLFGRLIFLTASLLFVRQVGKIFGFLGFRFARC